MTQNPEPKTSPQTGKGDPVSTADVVAMVDTLITLSQEILTSADAEDLNQINQALLKRGQLMAELNTIKLPPLEDSVRDTLTEKLATVKELDQQIERKFSQLSAHLQQQLNSVKDGRTKASQYKSASSREHTRTDHA